MFMLLISKFGKFLFLESLKSYKIGNFQNSCECYA